MTADAAHVAAVAEATAWTRHGVRYADDDAMQCMCGWDADGEPDRADLYRLHVATVAVETLTPLIRAQVAAEIRASAADHQPRQNEEWTEVCVVCRGIGAGYWPCSVVRHAEDAARIAEGTP